MPTTDWNATAQSPTKRPVKRSTVTDDQWQDPWYAHTAQPSPATHIPPDLRKDDAWTDSAMEDTADTVQRMFDRFRAIDALPTAPSPATHRDYAAEQGDSVTTLLPAATVDGYGSDSAVTSTVAPRRHSGMDIMAERRMSGHASDGCDFFDNKRQRRTAAPLRAEPPHSPRDRQHFDRGQSIDGDHVFTFSPDLVGSPNDDYYSDEDINGNDDSGKMMMDSAPAALMRVHVPPSKLKPASQESVKPLPRSPSAASTVSDSPRIEYVDCATEPGVEAFALKTIPDRGKSKPQRGKDKRSTAGDKAQKRNITKTAPLPQTSHKQRPPLHFPAHKPVAYPVNTAATQPPQATSAGIGPSSAAAAAQPSLSAANYHPIKEDSYSSLDSTQAPDDSTSNANTAVDILEENIYDEPVRSKEDLIKKFSKAAKHGSAVTVVKANSSSQRWWTRLFRLINFLRAVGTTSYGLYLVVSLWNNPTYLDLGAKSYFYATLSFLCLDLLVTLIKLFPTILWVFWDVKTWDPFTRTFSIWNLVADHELLLDMSPVLANVILKLYGFRLAEVVGNKNAVGSSGTPLASLGLDLDAHSANLTMLGIFVATLMLTILLHFLRLSRVLVTKKHAYSLTVIVLVKLALLLFDLATNAFLLYEVLVFKQERLFQMELIINLVLAVVAVSPAIGLTTNCLVNFPLHVTHLKMQLRKRKLPTGEQGEHVSYRRVFRAALRKTFHPFITGVFGVYAVFALIALGLVLQAVYRFDYTTALTIPSGLAPSQPQTSGTQQSVFSWEWWQDPRKRQQTLIVCVWLNIIINYAVGIICGCAYWLWQVITVLTCGQVTRRRSRY